MHNPRIVDLLGLDSCERRRVDLQLGAQLNDLLQVLAETAGPGLQRGQQRPIRRPVYVRLAHSDVHRSVGAPPQLVFRSRSAFRRCRRRMVTLPKSVAVCTCLRARVTRVASNKQRATANTYHFLKLHTYIQLLVSIYL